LFSNEGQESGLTCSSEYQRDEAEEYEEEEEKEEEEEAPAEGE
jgi:hypothetical protein